MYNTLYLNWQMLRKVVDIFDYDLIKMRQAKDGSQVQNRNLWSITGDFWKRTAILMEENLLDSEPQLST